MLNRYINKKPSDIIDWVYKKIRGVNISMLKEIKQGINYLPLLGKITNTISISEYLPNNIEAKKLSDLFRKYGSDKSTKHDYYLIYEYILKEKKEDKLNIFEMGLGTNNVTIPSNMSKEGKPGASLRAFRDYLPNAQIFGADIDSKILFTENRIETFFADQKKPETLTRLIENTRIPKEFDLIIDDGLHTPTANFNTIKKLIPLLKIGGFMAIEDIIEEFTPLWQVALATIPTEYETFLIKCKSETLALIKRVA